MFLTAYTLLSLPLSFISTIITIGILIPILELDHSAWAHTSAILWSNYIAAEQVTVALLMILENPLTGAITVLYVALLSLGIGSGAIRSLRNLPYWLATISSALPELCRYADGRTYLIERFTREGENISEVLNVELNLLISLAFAVGLIILNSILYLLPLPARVKAKFRE